MTNKTDLKCREAIHIILIFFRHYLCEGHDMVKSMQGRKKKNSKALLLTLPPPQSMCHCNPADKKIYKLWKRTRKWNKQQNCDTLGIICHSGDPDFLLQRAELLNFAFFKKMLVPRQVQEANLGSNPEWNLVDSSRSSADCKIFLFAAMVGRCCAPKQAPCKQKSEQLTNHIKSLIITIQH